MGGGDREVSTLTLTTEAKETRHSNVTIGAFNRQAESSIIERTSFRPQINIGIIIEAVRSHFQVSS